MLRYATIVFERSFEFEKCDGLGLIKGENISYVIKELIKSEKLDIPHINWRSIEFSSEIFEKKISRLNNMNFILNTLSWPNY